VLILYGHDPNAPGVVAFTNGLQSVIRAELPEPIELYNEVLDLDRFSDPSILEPIARYLDEKYRTVAFDAIVTEGSLALEFTTERLSELFAGVPVLYGLAFEPVVDFATLPEHVTGRHHPLPFAATLTLARSLQPDAERVILIAGSAPMDSLLFDHAVRALEPLRGGLELVPMRDWTYPSLLAELRELPPRSIAILSAFSGDRMGQRFNSGDLIASVTRAASVPAYGIARNWVGDGIVGGAVMDFAEDGRRVGQLLVRVLRGPRDSMPEPEVAIAAQVVDWRQLRRWGLSEGSLPPDTEVLFRIPTLWERYWTVIVGALVIMAAQAILITLLLVERRRRIRSQHIADESKGQVAHIARVATLGELAATVSHELRQPLTAIRMNAVAGGHALTLAQPDLSEASEIFRDIASDELRASEVLDHIRMLMRNETPTTVDVDINAVCSHATKLLEHHAAKRGVRIRLTLGSALPAVKGDAVQLEQVVLNLALNALDAVQTSNGKAGAPGHGLAAADDPEILVGTAAGSGTVQIFVRDTGPGVPPELQQRVFEPFFSTKSSGLGMGLAIVRSIVERHRGQVRAENVGPRGAVFWVELPIAESSEKLRG
jgi:signal transduction histidine kinase